MVLYSALNSCENQIQLQMHRLEFGKVAVPFFQITIYKNANPTIPTNAIITC